VGLWGTGKGLFAALTSIEGNNMPLVQHHTDLRVFQAGFEAAMRIMEASKAWPKDERYSLTDQIRRSSRAVCANVAEAWRKRRYEASFVSKLSDADAEAAETQVWLKFAHACSYLPADDYKVLYHQYDMLCGGLVKMMAEPDKWCGPSALREEPGSYSTFSISDDTPSD
jgi:four helix bundle protein